MSLDAPAVKATAYREPSDKPPGFYSWCDTRYVGDLGWEVYKHLNSLDSDTKLRPYLLISDLDYVDTHGMRHVIHAGYRTDFYSVPWIASRVIPKAGQNPGPAVLHDWYCDQREACYMDSKKVHQLLRESMRFAIPDIPAWKQRYIYAAVNLFGPRWTI